MRQANSCGPLGASSCILGSSSLPCCQLHDRLLNHETQHVTLLALLCTWFPFAPGIKSILISTAHEALHDLAPTNPFAQFCPYLGFALALPSLWNSHPSTLHDVVLLSSWALAQKTFLHHRI